MSNFVIAGVPLNAEQQQTLTNGGYTYLENMDRRNGEGKVSSYVFLNEEKDKERRKRKNNIDLSSKNELVIT